MRFEDFNGNETMQWIICEIVGNHPAMGVGYANPDTDFEFVIKVDGREFEFSRELAMAIDNQIAELEADVDKRAYEILQGKVGDVASMVDNMHTVVDKIFNWMYHQ